ncbi:MAG: RecQ family ATP-dependent DNA helicase [Oligoflexales bacterium]
MERAPLKHHDRIAQVALTFLPKGSPYKTQIQTIESILAKRNVLLVAPTGFGKSLCYQVPTKISGKPTLVVSPLIALMDDQASQNRSHGFRAGCLHSGRGSFEQWQTISKWIMGELDFIFTSPERLLSQSVLDSLALNPPGLIVIDEAHCISTWGTGFRPLYRKIGERVQGFIDTPILAMTATATDNTSEDIGTVFSQRSFETIREPIRFSNIAIFVHRVPTIQERVSMIIDLSSKPCNLPMVVFCPTKRLADGVTQNLAASGLRAYSFHAGLTLSERERALTLFQASHRAILVATSAFEMGINDRRIRSIVHCGLPASLESYVQGVGRAGRDGQKAEATLLFDDIDLDLHEAIRLRSSSTRAMAQDVYEFAKIFECRVKFLNRYFHGSAGSFELHPCHICDNCCRRNLHTITATKERELAIKSWRHQEALRSGKRAFQILSDREALRISIADPKDITDLQAITGIRRSVIKAFGSEIIRIIQDLYYNKSG